MPDPAEPAPPRLTRARLLVWVLAGLTALVAWQVWAITGGFLTSLVWAVSLAVVAMPVQRWLTRKVGGRAGLAAGLCVALLATVIIAPIAFVVEAAAGQVAKVAGVAQQQIKDNTWRQTVAKSPPLQKALAWVESQEGDIGDQLQGAAGYVGGFAGTMVASGVKTLTSLLLTLFFLFFFFRDRDDFLGYLRGLLPLTDPEADRFLGRIGDTIFATIYGTVMVRGIQGALGGLAFWFLGLPGAILWGAVMAIVSIIPVLGAFVVWVPAAIYLAATGNVGKAVIMTVWGVGVIGTVDNVLYPTLVGDRLKMHTVPVLVAMVGGLSVFGAAGLVAGPVALAAGDTLVKIWRERTRAGRSADETGPERA